MSADAPRIVQLGFNGVNEIVLRGRQRLRQRFGEKSVLDLHEIASDH